MYKIRLTNLPALFQALAAQATLYVPATNKAGKVDFTKYTKGVEVNLEAHLTSKSLKDVFFPQVESLLAFKTEGKRLQIEAPKLADEPTIAFGVRACDARSFDILDMVFLKEPVDAYYQTRRNSCVLIGLGCTAPEETCFCGTFGIDATRPQTDIATWIVGDKLYWQAQTEKGEALTRKVHDFFSPAGAEGEAIVEKANEATKAILKALPLGSFKIAGKIPADELKTFNSEVWDQLAAGCLSCCSCTYVCPTCHCYDIRDYAVSETKTERFRCWDSCMNRDFTKMAGGNPRKTKLERFRQRYMHKLVYFPENNEGVFACVGCGRCLSKCPVNLNIVKVAKALEVAKDV